MKTFFSYYKKLIFNKNNTKLSGPRKRATIAPLLYARIFRQKRFVKNRWG